MYFQQQAGIEEHEQLPQAALLDGHWHVLRVRSNYEKLVAQQLVVRDVEHYLPLYQERVRWTDRTVVAERPLFPGYVFARYLAQSRITVMSTPGVAYSLGDQSGDLVSCAELDQIRNGLRSGLLLRPHPYISAGTRVRIRNGVFADVEGIVEEFRRQSKVVISVAAARQCFSLEVESSDLEIMDKLSMQTSQATGSY